MSDRIAQLRRKDEANAREHLPGKAPEKKRYLVQRTSRSLGVDDHERSSLGSQRLGCGDVEAHVCGRIVAAGLGGVPRHGECALAALGARVLAEQLERLE